MYYSFIDGMDRVCWSFVPEVFGWVCNFWSWDDLIDRAYASEGEDPIKYSWINFHVYMYILIRTSASIKSRNVFLRRNTSFVVIVFNVSDKIFHYFLLRSYVFLDHFLIFWSPFDNLLFWDEVRTLITAKNCTLHLYQTCYETKLLKNGQICM